MIVLEEPFGRERAEIADLIDFVVCIDLPLEIALARNAEFTAVKQESADLNEQLETRKVVDRAKGRLMDSKGMTESEAFRHLQKKAMDERRSMKEVAEEILA